MPEPNLKVVTSNRSFTIDDSGDPLIKEGVYRCKLDHWVTVRLPMFKNAEKLVLTFSIIDFGECMNTKVRAFYNVKLMGKPQKYGNFKPPKRGKFMMDFCTCFPNCPIKRADRIPLSFLEKAIIKCRVKTISKNHKQVGLPEALQYSIIDSLMGVDDP